MLNFLKKDIDISSLSWFKTKTSTKYYYEINSKEDITKLSLIYNFCKENDLSSIVIWEWTNIMFAWDIYKWVVIKNNLKWFKIDFNKAKIYSWELISDFCLTLKNEYKIDNLYPWISLPWTLGWAIFWNAGCFWLRAEDIFIEGEILELDSWKIKIFNKDDMDFSYRNSFLKRNNNYFLISATLNINYLIETKTYEEICFFRQNKQPKWLSCGSFFINPEWQSAWKLIEDAGLKWYKIWWAYISELHANFIMSDWNATYNDILLLKNHIIKEVSDRFWIELKEEVRLIY